ncbi:MAG: SH3 domain-containing protein, partial [Eubacterium sp.]|nr:SH3 domain-containing protein [Eubacterium sp.]
NKKDSTNKKEKKAEEKDQSEKQKKWANKLIADVDDYLNIRSASNEGSKVVGKLRKGDVAKVIKKGKTWTKIKSGSVTGYVHNEYCLYGSKAYKLAKKICNTYATVKADGLRIRKQANKDATVLEAAFKGDKLVVNTKAKPKDGWVIVNFDDQKGFVADEFVKVSLGSEAISIEEEKAQIAASQKVSPSSSSSPSSNSTAASSSQSVSSSDLTLLSAIIFCEAGGESYSGQVAVGAVVMNRVKSSSFPNSISGVVYQSGQFSPVANGALARALSNGNYQHCISAAQAALAGNDNTGGAKFFHRANGAAGLIIGNHVFY